LSSEPRHAELPEELRPVMRRAVRLEWLTIGYMLTAVVAVGLTLGQSQAMKAVWVEDVVSLLPPIAFLIAARVRHKPPDEEHQWGYHRITSIAFLAAAIALLTFGLIILGDSLFRLALAERPPVGVTPLFGHEPWAGWLMLAALAYSGLPPVVLGRMKQKLAAELHDKVLYADAQMNRADWMTAGAGAIGVVGIGFGLWFADAVAGAVIALDIVRDGVRHVKSAGKELMDARPTTYDLERPHPLAAECERALHELEWVRDVRVRLREEGHVFAGEAHVVPASDHDLTGRLDEAAERLLGLDWRLHDIIVAPATADGFRRLTPRG
jgi:cation diffusion facilitator family transporter